MTALRCEGTKPELLNGLLLRPLTEEKEALSLALSVRRVSSKTLKAYPFSLWLGIGHICTNNYLLPAEHQHTNDKSYQQAAQT
jgi:hypothetical protein